MKKDFVDFIIDEFERRKSINSDYTASTFAKDLNMSAPRLNQLLSRKIGLSVPSARVVADRLGLSAKNTILFLTLVEAKHSRSHVSRMIGRKKLTELTTEKSQPMTEKTFSAIKEWYTAAIFSLIHVEGFQLSAEWISKRLGITLAQAQSSIDKLVSNGFFQKNGDRWERTTRLLQFVADKKNNDIKDYNLQLLDKAKESVYGSSPDQREIGAFMLSVQQDDIIWIRERMSDFKNSILKELMGRQGPFDRVYCLNLLYYPMDVAK